MSAALVGAAEALVSAAKALSDAATAFAANAAPEPTTFPLIVNGRFHEQFVRQLKAGDELCNVWIEIKMPANMLLAAKPETTAAPAAVPAPPPTYVFGTTVRIGADAAGADKFRALIADPEALARVTHLEVGSHQDKIGGGGGASKYMQTHSVFDDIVDVSMLRHIDTLHLYGLANLANVGVLGGADSGVRDLTLVSLPLVTSLDGLGGGSVRDLTMRGLPNIVSLAPVRTVSTLCLTGGVGTGITSIADLAAPDSRLKGFECSNGSLKQIDDVSALRGVDEVDLHAMPNVTDVSPLRHARHVHLVDMTGVGDVSPLRGASEVVIGGMPLVTDVSALRGVKTLTLFMLENVTDVSMLRGVDELRLDLMDMVTDISRLVNVVPTLSVKRCGCVDYKSVTTPSSSML